MGPNSVAGSLWGCPSSEQAGHRAGYQEVSGGDGGMGCHGGSESANFGVTFFASAVTESGTGRLSGPVVQLMRTHSPNGCKLESP
jgi:hypothetical protein